MSLNINKLLQVPDPVKDEIFPGFYKGELGLVVNEKDSDKNIICLTLVFAAAGIHTELKEMLSPNKSFSLHKKKTKNRRVFYLSIGDTKSVVKKTTNLFLNDLTESQKTLLEKEIFFETLSSISSTSDIKDCLFSMWQERNTPDLVVINASNYINEMPRYNFRELLKELLFFSEKTGSAILVLRELNDKLLEIKTPFSWRILFHEHKKTNKQLEYNCLFWNGDKIYEENFIFENEKIKRLKNHELNNRIYSKEQIPSLEEMVDLWKKTMREGLRPENKSFDNTVKTKIVEAEQKNEPVYTEKTNSDKKNDLFAPTHVFIKSFKPYDDRKGNGEQDFKRITTNIHAGSSIPLAVFSGGQKNLNGIRNKLNSEFPWFEKITTWVIQSLQGKLYFAEKTKSPVVVSIPPILLIGPPGIGKTEWAATFAECLEIPFDTFGIAGTATGFENIASIGRWWDKPRPSRILSFVADCKIANPLFLLDEIDKQNSNRYTGTPQHALLAYFDRNATNLFDDFLEGYIDVSRLNIIMTANDISLIDEPLLSRLEVMETPRPRPEHVPPILKNMRKRLAKEMNVDTEDIHISDKVVKTIEQGLTKEEDLRKIWQNMRAAFLEEITGTNVRMPNGTKKTIGF